jgi:hypothetical protein
MQNILKHLVLILFVLSTSFCKTKNIQSSSTKEKTNFIEATVINYHLDGCSWILQLADEKKLEPVNLKEEFKKENLNVWIKYEPYNGASICMAGEMVTIKDIQLRNED